MATDQILQLLISERDKLSQAILALQGAKSRGRPPKTVARIASPTPAPARKKRTFSKAQREAARARMKAYWAAKRRGK